MPSWSGRRSDRAPRPGSCPMGGLERLARFLLPIDSGRYEPLMTSVDTKASEGATARGQEPPEAAGHFSRIMVAVDLLDWDLRLPSGSHDLKHAMSALGESGAHRFGTVVLQRAMQLAWAFGGCLEIVHVRPSHLHEAVTGPFI